MDKLLTVCQAAEYLQLHPNTIYKLVKRDEIPFIRIKGLGIRFRKDEIDEWLKQGSLKIHSFIESFSKVDLALDEYDRLFLGGERMSRKGKTWSYPFGSVYFRLTKTGKERWYIYYRVDGERIRKAVKNAQSRADALKVLQIEVADAFRGKYGFKREKKRIKFMKFAEEYIENYAKVNKRSWKDDVYCIGIIGQFFENSYVHDINSFDIEKLKMERLKKGISKSRVNRYLALLKKMFNLAIDWGYLRDNPVRKVRFFSEKDNIKERILNLEEERKLLGAGSEHLRPIILTALHTGMRRGEILSLEWDQVDLTKRIIRVEKTKSGKTRIIPISNFLFKELSSLKEKNGKPDYVFLNPKTGKPIKEIKTAFNGATRRAGIKDLRFHDLRHTFASRLVERGVDLITVKELLGHHSVVITQRYTHSSSEQKRRAVENLAQIEVEDLKFVPILSTRKQGRLSNGLFTAN